MMKIKEIQIKGFRGFNELRQIEFDHQLTLIYAQNSYGKTSISESFEWAIYGTTSKIRSAESKDEYKGSLRNVHFPSAENPRVTLVFADDGVDHFCECELVGDERKSSWDGRPVDRWPFIPPLEVSPQPFILQHALKDLLLASPIDRFKDFARLLGLESLSRLRQDLIAFCTCPPLPRHLSNILGEVNLIVGRVEAQPTLKEIAKSLKSGPKHLDQTYQLIWDRANRLVPIGTGVDSVLAALLRIRDEEVGKIFQGKIELPSLSEKELEQCESDSDFLVESLSLEFAAEYASLNKSQSAQRITDLAKLHELGIRLIEEQPGHCPLCMQPIDTNVMQHIRDSHHALKERQEEFSLLEAAKMKVTGSLNLSQDRLAQYHDRLSGKSGSLLKSRGSLEALSRILSPKDPASYEAIKIAVEQLDASDRQLHAAFEKCKAQIADALKAIALSQEDEAIAKELGQAVVAYIRCAAEHKAAIAAHASTVTEAGRVLQHRLDSLAGTQEISALVDLMSNKKAVLKKFRIDEALESLKELKQEVDNFVTQKLLDVISGEFGTEVMEWYRKIKTSGDPDVHFSGFDMKRTAQGGRVQIKARSYARDLVSAVSSLSESKLNVLGLCLSIAINVKSDSPFDFLVLDDPIQSWDDQHETKFVDVIQELVGRGKQVILLTHDFLWMKQVRARCAHLNGRSYEITGYTKAGPQIQEVKWAENSQRLNTILGIIQDSLADSIRLQQAEEEVRLVLNQLTADLYLKKNGDSKEPPISQFGRNEKDVTRMRSPDEPCK